MSSRLTSESRIYADKAKDLNRQVGFVIVWFFPTHLWKSLSYMGI